MEDVGEVSPDNFFFEGGEAERRAGALLRGASVVVRLKVMSGELIAEPAQAVGFEIEAQEFDGVGVRKVEIGIGVEAGDPGGPVLMFEVGEQRVEIGDGDVGMILDGLPEMLGGIVSSAVKRDAFGDRIPVGKDACGNGRSSAPAVDGVFPFLLDCDEGFGVSGGSGFGDLPEGAAEFVFSVCVKGFERTLVVHGNDAAFDAAVQNFAGELLALCVVEGWVARPAVGLGVDVREELGERLEFYECVQGEGDGMAVFCYDGGRRDEGLKGDGLSVERGRQDGD